MKLMDKLKNALFEEEYVEVEEKPRQKIKREKGKSKPEKPIAKKISVPERPIKQEKKMITPEKEEVVEENEEKELLKENTEFRFPAMAEEDFSITQPFDIIDEKSTRSKELLVRDEKPLYQASKIETKSDYENHANRVGVYEKKQEHTGFRPSPIISPIYGVLDKNYTKEEVKEKREVRISTFSKEDLDLDAVRRKAYGSLEDEIVDVSSEFSPEQEEEEENLLVDLSSEDTPTVNKVTVGDAEEYFEDLGLEYNKDYIDASKEKASGRRLRDDKDYDDVPSKNVEVEEKKEVPSVDDSDNLFDLIDSMYNEE